MTSVRSCLMAGVAALYLTAAADASATTCGTLGPNQLLYFATGTTSCYATGEGQINRPNQHPFGLSSPLVFLDESGHRGDPEEGALSIRGHSWSITPPAGYSHFVLLFEQSNDSHRGPDWGAFLLSDTTGAWLISTLSIHGDDHDHWDDHGDRHGDDHRGNRWAPINLDLSHAILYGVAETPLPAAFLLFGSVLIGSGGIAGWRKLRGRIAA